MDAGLVVPTSGTWRTRAMRAMVPGVTGPVIIAPLSVLGDRPGLRRRVEEHLARLQRCPALGKEGGLGRLDIPLLSDLTHTISKVTEQYFSP